MKMTSIMALGLLMSSIATLGYAQDAVGGVMGSGRATGSAGVSGGAIGSGVPTSQTQTGARLRSDVDAGATVNSQTQTGARFNSEMRGAPTLQEDLDRIEREGQRIRTGARTTIDSPSERRTDLESNARGGIRAEADIDTGAGITTPLDNTIGTAAGIRTGALTRNE